MMERAGDDPFESDELLAEIRAEFCDGLGDRLATLQRAVERLAEDEPDAAESLYRTAHTLKGTAPSFGAEGLVQPASALADLGRRWCEGESVSAAGIKAAREQLGHLGVAIERYVAKVRGG